MAAEAMALRMSGLARGCGGGGGGDPAGGRWGTIPPADDILNIMVVNEWFVADRWRSFCDVCRPMRARVCKADLDKHTLSRSLVNNTAH